MAFVKPERKILGPADIHGWCNSEAYSVYMEMLRSINESIKSRSTKEAVAVSEPVQSLINLLDTIDSWIVDFPPKDLDSQRFGNKAFRDWHAKLVQGSENMLISVLSESTKGAAVELAPYFIDSFGNSTRIDYGSGHEAAFLMVICCLFQLKIFDQSDFVAVALRLFDRYMKVVRKLQLTYRMEPAGSHGVHSLDDFQFVPFIWGSAQLIGREDGKLTTDSFVQEELVDQYLGDNLFFDAVKYINQTKTGPFSEHSNQLWNISGVQSWSKINSGLFKMYEAEVLKKFPIVQHIVFGTLLSFQQKH